MAVARCKTSVTIGSWYPAIVPTVKVANGAAGSGSSKVTVYLKVVIVLLTGVVEAEVETSDIVCEGGFCTNEVAVVADALAG